MPDTQELVEIQLNGDAKGTWIQAIALDTPPSPQRCLRIGLQCYPNIYYQLHLKQTSSTPCTLADGQSYQSFLRLSKTQQPVQCS